MPNIHLEIVEESRQPTSRYIACYKSLQWSNEIKEMTFNNLYYTSELFFGPLQNIAC